MCQCRACVHLCTGACVHLCTGVVITPLVIRASRDGHLCCHHSAAPAVANNVASLRLSESVPDTRSSASRAHHYHHHHHTLASSNSGGGSTADGRQSTQLVIRPAYDNQPSLKRLHGSSSEILRAKATSIDAPLEQLSLPPPLIPVPSVQSTAPSRLASSAGSARARAHAPRRSLPSTPPPVPVRRSVGSVHETSTGAPAVPPLAAVDSSSSASETKPDAAAAAPSNECVVCLERAPDAVLYTCGHMCMCHACARDVVQNRGALCPICRQAIRDVIKIFRS